MAMNVGGWLFSIGSLLGFFAVALSLLWHRIDKLLDVELAATDKDAVTEEMMEAWVRRRNRQDWVRRIGVWCLYGGMVLIFLAAMYMGFDHLDRGVAQCQK